jgi:hypothetical protein
MVTGFEIDNQNIAKEQVRATNRVAVALERLCDILEKKEVAENMKRLHNIK